jgi:Glutathione S-transferase, C-terminal domain
MNEDQKDQALRRGHFFRSERRPKYLGYFERVAALNDESAAR